MYRRVYRRWWQQKLQRAERKRDCQSCEETQEKELWGKKQVTKERGRSGIGTCSPYITALRLSTGFQSSRRTFKQIFPAVSILGWYIYVSTSPNPKKRYLLSAADFRRLMGIFIRNSKWEMERSSFIQSWHISLTHNTQRRNRISEDTK